MKAATVNLEKLRNAYWRMDDALDEIRAHADDGGGLANGIIDAQAAHGLFWDILKDIDTAMTENIRPGDDLSPANNND